MLRLFRPTKTSSTKIEKSKNKKVFKSQDNLFKYNQNAEVHQINKEVNKKMEQY